MNYSIKSTADTPAYVVYLIDVSGSMNQKMPDTGKRRIDVATDLLLEIAQVMFRRSRKGARVSPRYKIATYFYSDKVIHDKKDNSMDFMPISDFVEHLPDFPHELPPNYTNTYAGFEAVYKLLERTLKTPELSKSPAPLVCHLTDGEYTQECGDPSEVVKQIMQLKNNDGNVLVQNIYLNTEEPLTHKPISNVKNWPGIHTHEDLANQYAKKLFDMSSPLPETYANALIEDGYRLKAGARMVFPANASEMIRLAFALSEATGRTSYERRPNF